MTTPALTLDDHTVFGPELAQAIEAGLSIRATLMHSDVPVDTKALCRAAEAVEALQQLRAELLELAQQQFPCMADAERTALYFPSLAGEL